MSCQSSQQAGPRVMPRRCIVDVPALQYVYREDDVAAIVASWYDDAAGDPPGTWSVELAAVRENGDRLMSVSAILSARVGVIAVDYERVCDIMLRWHHRANPAKLGTMYLCRFRDDPGALDGDCPSLECEIMELGLTGWLCWSNK